MGSLTLPASGKVYVDTAPIMYSVKKHDDYWELLQPLWIASKAGQIQIVTSELTLLETLVAPYRHGDVALADRYEELLTATEVRLEPITSEIVRSAARLRADLNFRTPDAIHAATALEVDCSLLITNDADLRRMTGIAVALLKNLAET